MKLLPIQASKLAYKLVLRPKARDFPPFAHFKIRGAEFPTLTNSFYALVKSELIKVQK